MSSANQNNVLTAGEKRIEKEDVKGKELFLNRPTFEDAGISYNNGVYPKRVVTIRMPISEQTTEEEVDAFFTNFARSFHTQQKEITQEKDTKGESIELD